MKANELRIGNWVVAPATPFEAVKINIDALKYFGDDLIPIPLTEDWLIKFGFDMINDAPKTIKYYRLNGISFEVLKDDRVANKPNEALKLYDNIGLWNTTYKHIKNVHQLQNLHFALTGEELEINEHS